MKKIKEDLLPSLRYHVRYPLVSATVLTLKGEASVYTVQTFKDIVLSLVDSNPRTLVVDFGQVRFIDGSTLLVLQKVCKRLKPRLVLVCRTEGHSGMFELAGFDRKSIFRTRKEALSKSH